MVNSYSMSLRVGGPEHDPGPDLADEVHGQVGKRLDAHVRVRRRHLPGQFDSLVQTEVRRLVRINPDPDDQFVHDLAAPLDDVQMAKVDGVEDPGVNGPAETHWGHAALKTSRNRSRSSTVL